MTKSQDCGVSERYGFEDPFRGPSVGIPSALPDYERFANCLHKLPQAAYVWSRLETQAFQAPEGVVTRFVLDVHGFPVRLEIDHTWQSVYVEAPVYRHLPRYKADEILELLDRWFAGVEYKVEADRTLIAHNNYPFEFFVDDTFIVLTGFCNCVRRADLNVDEYLESGSMFTPDYPFED